MLVVKPRGGGNRQYRYGGSGIFDALSRKIFSGGFKKIISTGARAAIAQKVADAVVNGATSATKKAVEEGVNEVISKAKPYILNKLRRLKRSHPKDESGERKDLKKTKININSLIDGSGIVFD